MEMTRRFFLQSTGMLAVYCGVSPIEAVAAAAVKKQAARQGKTLVCIFLRGGIDGLNLVVPYGDPGYAPLRPSLKINHPGKEGGALDIDGFFGLHPRMNAVMPLVGSGQLVAAHAVGYAKNSRSHFEEQDVWETGVVGNTIGSDGWLNRHLMTSTGHGPVRAIALGDTLPRILRGKATAYAVRGLSDLNISGNASEQATLTSALEHAYQRPTDAMASDARDLVADTGAATLDGVKVIRKVAGEAYKPDAKYPDTPLANRLQVAARLIKSGIGLEVVEIDYSGWDTHNNQGRGPQGPYADRVQQLGDALAAFHQDMGKQIDDTLVLTLSDFGRTAKENGSRGTDHGWANAMLAMGGPVARAGAAGGVTGAVSGITSGGGGRVVTKWPGLMPEQLHQKRDLLHTTDFRDVLSEVVSVHLGNPNLSRIMPNHIFKPVGLVA